MYVIANMYPEWEACQGAVVRGSEAQGLWSGVVRHGDTFPNQLQPRGNMQSLNHLPATSSSYCAEC